MALDTEQACAAALAGLPEMTPVRLAALPASGLDGSVPLDGAAQDLLERHLRSGRLSARGLHRVRRVARTVADLGDTGPIVGAPEVAEALFLRGSRALLLGEEGR